GHAGAILAGNINQNYFFHAALLNAGLQFNLAIVAVAARVTNRAIIGSLSFVEHIVADILPRILDGPCYVYQNNESYLPSSLDRRRQCE
ncbi:MAG TPA: hypothetical protein VLC91_00905, partial [Spongiibacteraceae bacterium]|nr:hypothetical protein [Spongiibacteraceae bacterium]